MTEQELRDLLPRSKMDVAHAKQIAAVGYPAVMPILPAILEWLQDSNWPVAQALHPFVQSIGAPLVPYIRTIFQGQDETWKYFLIVSVIKHSPELARSLKAELARIAWSPTPAEEAEEVAEVAQEAMEELFGERAG